MAPNISHDADCPCGSGKPFGDCCAANRIEIRRLRWPLYPEEFTLGPLLRDSKEFRLYYESQRAKVKGDVLWAEDTQLPPGIDYRATHVGSGERVIRLRHIPARPGLDTRSIAHELEHFVLAEEGFPGLAAQDRLEDLASALNSMLTDPLVNRRIAAFGFESRPDYDAEAQNARAALERLPEAPPDNVSRLHWVFNHAGKLLDWDLVRQPDEPERDEYIAWFESRYPRIAAEARRLYDSVRRASYDTPEAMAALLVGIARGYGLQPHVRLGRVIGGRTHLEPTDG